MSDLESVDSDYSSEYDDYDDFEISHPPPNKKYRVTPLCEYIESDVSAPTILGNLLPMPPPPKPETKESIQQLLAPYKPKPVALHAQNTRIYHPRISVTKHKPKHHAHRTNIHHTIQSNSITHSNAAGSSTCCTISRTVSESASIINGYITIYDVPDSCWSLIFQFCNVQDLVFNIASTNKFFQSLVVDQSTWIHRNVILPSQIYKPSLKKKTEHTLESMFLNWTSLKQLDIMLDPETDSERVTLIWRMLCTPRPKIMTLRIGNSISLPGGDTCAVNETAFKYLKLIQDIEVLDFSFNMFCVSYEAIVDFFAAQAGQIYNPPPKPKRNYLSHWTAKQNEKLNQNKAKDRNSTAQNNVNTDPKVHDDKNNNNNNIKDPDIEHIDNRNTSNRNGPSDTTAESAVIEHQTISNAMDEEEHREENTESHATPPSEDSALPKLVLNETEKKEDDDKDTNNKKIRTPAKRRKVRLIRTPSSADTHTNTNAHKRLSNSAESYRLKPRRRSVLGKRSRVVIDLTESDGEEPRLSPKKKRKYTTKSQKREMDSEDESRDTHRSKVEADNAREEDADDDDVNTEGDIHEVHTFPRHLMRRKRRRVSDTFLVRRSLHNELERVSPKRRKKSIHRAKSDSKRELSASPPVHTTSKKLSYTKRRKHTLYKHHHNNNSNYKRHYRMMRSDPSHSHSPVPHGKKSNFRIRYPYHGMNDRSEMSPSATWTHDSINNDNNNHNRSKSNMVKKEVMIPKEFNTILSSTPSPITSPIIDDEAFRSSIYGKKVRKTILSNIDRELMSTLRLLNSDELELNLSLTLNIDSIDIGLNDNDNDNIHSLDDNDNDKYYESYRENLSSDYLHIGRKKDSMKDLGRKSKLRRIYFREVCMKSFPDLAYNYLNTKRIESLSLYTGDTSSLIAFIDKCGSYPIIKKIEIDGTSPFRWRCAPLCEALTKCINLCSIQLPSIVDAVDIIAFDSFINAAINLTEIGLVTGDRQLFKPIHDVINKHGFKMDINPSGLRFIFARRKNKPELRQKYMKNKKQFLQRKRSNTY